MRDLQERFQFANLIGAGPTRNTLRLKSFSPAQPPQRPTFSSNVDVRSFSAPGERKRAGVEWYNLEGDTCAETLFAKD